MIIIVAIILGVIAIIFAIIRQTGRMNNIPSFKKYQNIIVVLSVFGITGSLIFWFLIPYLMRWQMSGREATIIGLMIYPAIIIVIWSILKKYLADLIEIKSGEIITGCVIVVVLIVYTYFSVPSVYFDQKTGESKVWLDEKNKIYFSDGYNPETGEKLHLATKEEMEEILSKSPSSDESKASPADYPLCAGAKTIYITPSKEEINGFKEVIINAVPGCYTAPVIIIREKIVFVESFSSGFIFRKDSDEFNLHEEHQGSPSIYRGHMPNGVQWQFMAKEKPETVKIRVAVIRERLYDNL